MLQVTFARPAYPTHKSALLIYPATPDKHGDVRPETVRDLRLMLGADAVVKLAWLTNDQWHGSTPHSGPLTDMDGSSDLAG